MYSWTFGLFPLSDYYNAAISIHVQGLCNVCFHFSLGVELQDHLVILCLIVSGTTKLFSEVVAPFYILTSSV